MNAPDHDPTNPFAPRNWPLDTFSAPPADPLPSGESFRLYVKSRAEIVRRGFVQARGALLLDAMVDKNEKPYGTTVVALAAIDEGAKAFEEALAAMPRHELAAVVITDEIVETASRAYDPMAWHSIDQAAGVHGMLEPLRLQLLSSMRAALTALADPAPSVESLSFADLREIAMFAALEKNNQKWHPAITISHSGGIDFWRELTGRALVAYDLARRSNDVSCVPETGGATAESRDEIARLGDNHHNAYRCPYCNPEREAALARAKAEGMEEAARIVKEQDGTEDGETWVIARAAAAIRAAIPASAAVTPKKVPYCFVEFDPSVSGGKTCAECELTWSASQPFSCPKCEPLP